MNSFRRAAAVMVGWGGFALGAGYLAGLTAEAQGGFHPNPHLYSETANPTEQIAAAERVAQREHKHILLEFGGNWCSDCQVLDYYYHQAPNAALISQSYVVVYVDVGHIDKNLDVAKRYNTPVDHGVPSLTILDARGKLLYAEQPKEFERTTPEALYALLNRWKPVGAR